MLDLIPLALEEIPRYVVFVESLHNGNGRRIALVNLTRGKRLGMIASRLSHNLGLRLLGIERIVVYNQVGVLTGNRTAG